jgi:hypothetical protein
MYEKAAFDIYKVLKKHQPLIGIGVAKYQYIVYGN